MFGRLLKDLEVIKAAVAAGVPGGTPPAAPVDLSPVMTRLDAIQAAIGAQPSVTSAGLPPGWLQAFLPTAIPEGFVPCDGRAIRIADHPGLFAMFGHTYSAAQDETAARALAMPITPTMTSNTAPSGTASASSIYSSTYDAWRAFDSSQSTGWMSNTSQPSWLRYDMPSGIYRHITAYGIRPMVDGSYINAPSTWFLEGSSDGVSWVQLDMRRSISEWAAGIEKVFELDSSMMTGRHRMFRVFVYEKSSTGSAIGIGELRLLGLDVMPMLSAPEGHFGLPNLAAAPTPIQGGVWCIKVV